MNQPLLTKGRLCPLTRLCLTSLILFLPFAGSVKFCKAQQKELLKGIVVSATDDEPLHGATINVKGLDISTQTAMDGRFSLNPGIDSGELIISHLGFITQNVKFNSSNTFLEIDLDPSAGMLDEVVVNTGYQQFTKKHATGSFEVIDTELLNRSPSPNLLERLEGVTSGTLFSISSSKQYHQSDIQIRGRSTLYANSDPLIVVDNFPFDGSVTEINPNDVESITILKDAAAASIWGVRAGNGVIVITTKKGRFNTKPEINVSSSFSIEDKPDIYYLPMLTSTEYIEVEKNLFDLGAYDTDLNRGYRAVSPVVEALSQHREGKLSEQELNIHLQKLAKIDARNNISEYFYRNKTTQRHQFDLRGGSRINKYFISVNYNNTLPADVTTRNQFVSLTANNSIDLLDGKLQFFSGLNISKNLGKISGIHHNTPTSPYEQLLDEDGNALPIPRHLRVAYADTAGQGKLLDWNYRPLDELRNSGVTQNRRNDRYRVNTSISYKLVKDLELSAQYMYEKGLYTQNGNHAVYSYSTRHTINSLSRINPETGEVIRPVPLGDILTLRTEHSQTHNGRLQTRWNTSFSQFHDLDLVAGWEVKEYTSGQMSHTLYGYDPETDTHQNNTINYVDYFPVYYSGGTMRIPELTSKQHAIDRYYSYYGNLNYSFKDVYGLSLSARKDASNLFGVKSNLKGVSLWSAGFSFNISKLRDYKLEWLPYLRLRATYGFSGNIDKSVSAYFTAETGFWPHDWGRQYYQVVNPPNPSLRWEKVKNFNLGIDFSIVGNIIRGSIEYWSKQGIDLIGTSPIASQTGATVFKGNTASNRNRGIELNITSRNLSGPLKWSTTYILNTTDDAILKYAPPAGSNFDVLSTSFNNPLEGYPFYSMFSFPWAGLSDTGAPRVYFQDEISTDYANIANSQDRLQLKYHGPLLPRLFGSVRNELSYKGVTLSFNIGFKFGHYFRTASLDNSYLNNGGFLTNDYSLRWKKPGDEEETHVPALVYPTDTRRGIIYKYSSVLVEKASHIRINDIRASFDLTHYFPKKLNINRLILFGHANHIGILWKATNTRFDPDQPNGLPAPRSYSVGIRMNF